MLGKYQLVLLSIEDTIDPDQISNSIWRSATPNLQGTSTMLHSWLQTLIIVPLSSPSPTYCYSQVFQILIHGRTCCHFSAPRSLCFLCIVESLSLVSTLEVLLFTCNSSMKTTSGHMSLDIRWVYLGPTGFHHFCADGTAGQLLMWKESKHASLLPTDTHYCTAFQPFVNILSPSTAKYFKFCLLTPEHLLPFSAPQFLCFIA